MRLACRAHPAGDCVIRLKEAREDAFGGMDIVLGAAENDIAKKFAPAIKAAGAVFVEMKL